MTTLALAILAAGQVLIANTTDDAATIQPALSVRTQTITVEVSGEVVERNTLLHFEAPWCRACSTLDRLAFDNPRVLAAISERYTVERINADQRPDLVAKYHVRSLPFDVVLRPDGSFFRSGPCADSSIYVRSLGVEVEPTVPASAKQGSSTGSACRSARMPARGLRIFRRGCRGYR